MVSGYVTDLASPHRRGGLKGRKGRTAQIQKQAPHVGAPTNATGGLRPANCGTPFGRPLLLFRDHVAMHVRAEDFRYDDGTVSLLVVFQDSGDGTADSQAGAVQGMDEFRFRFRRAAEADIGPACLEIFRIGARRDFTVFPL